MKKKKGKEKKKRSKLRKCIYPASVFAVIAVCAYVLVPGFRELDGVRARIVEMERSKQQQESRNASLKKEIASMDTSEGIERAARRHLRVAMPDEVIVRFQSPEEEKSTER